jgi:hypothetical protein
VPLEVGDFLFQPLNAFVQQKAVAWPRL